MDQELKNAILQAMTTRFEVQNQLIYHAWQDESFKQELLANPKQVYARELGEELPKYLEIQVMEETENKVYLVLPINPEATIANEEELSEEDLETVAGGVCQFRTTPIQKHCTYWLLSKLRSANDSV
ncbi:MAG: NHLP leader peptide family RiPP precursor [Nostoc sp. LLA-1]|nr:NHLP leader peptide family RiPP precursor [Cyanocohniella sp. LLY]